MNRLLIWGAGYSSKAAAEASTGDLEQFRKLGAVVWFVAVWTAINWSIASTAFMTDASTPARLGLALGCGLAGLGFILLFDRTMLYVLDTRLGRHFAWLWLVFRVVLILAVGTFTTERVIPIFLHAELQHQALIEREASEENRQRRLDARFQLPELTERADTARAEVRQIEAESRIVPPQIQAALDRVEACRRSVATERARLIRQGHGRRIASQRLAGRSARCRRAAREAQADLAAFRSEMAESLRQARAFAADSGAAHQAATAAVGERLAGARAVEAEAIAPGSSIVLGRMILSNPAAAVTAGVLLIVMLSVELFPFVLKSFAGRTALGTRLGAERAIASLEPTTQLRCKEHEVEVAVASSHEAAVAMVEALRSEAVRSFMRQQAIVEVQRLAPMTGAVRTLREIERSRRIFDEAAERRPDLASIIYRLWVQAVRNIGGEPDASAI